MSWPMAEKLIIRALAAHDVRSGVDLPGGDKALDGFVRVARGPGSDDGTTDSPLIDLEAFHADIEEAWNLSEKARQIVLSLVGSGDTGHVIDRVETASGPTRAWYGSNLERYVSSYRVEFRR